MAGGTTFVHTTRTTPCEPYPPATAGGGSIGNNELVETVVDCFARDLTGLFFGAIVVGLADDPEHAANELIATRATTRHTADRHTDG